MINESVTSKTCLDIKKIVMWKCQEHGKWSSTSLDFLFVVSVIMVSQNVWLSPYNSRHTCKKARTVEVKHRQDWFEGLNKKQFAGYVIKPRRLKI